MSIKIITDSEDCSKNIIDSRNETRISNLEEDRMIWKHICNSTFNSIMKIAVKNKKPIGNGIITVNNLTQANKRKNKKGIEAAMAVATILFNEPK